MLLAVFRALTAAGVLAVVLSVVAAGSTACERGSASEPTTRDRLTACELLTRDEAALALGDAVRRPDATDDEGADALAGRSGCAWSTADRRSAALFELVRTEDMAASVRRTGFSATARFSAARSHHPDAAQSEIGERSFWVEEIGTMYVLTGTSYLVIEVATPRTSDAAAVAGELARLAVQRLESQDRQTGADVDE